MGQLWAFFDLYIKENVDFSRIQTQMVGVEGEHADHETTTTSAFKNVLSSIFRRFLRSMVRPLGSVTMALKAVWPDG